MSCGRPESVGTATATGAPASSSPFDASISALIAKPEPVCRWQSRQWQQLVNMGGARRR